MVEEERSSLGRFGGKPLTQPYVTCLNGVGHGEDAGDGPVASSYLCQPPQRVALVGKGAVEHR